jgi:hypothetical protein
MYMTLLVSRRQRHRALSLSCFALLVVMAVCLAQRAGLVTVCPASLAMMESAHHDDTTDTSDTDNCQLTGRDTNNVIYMAKNLIQTLLKLQSNITISRNKTMKKH